MTAAARHTAGHTEGRKEQATGTGTQQETHGSHQATHGSHQATHGRQEGRREGRGWPRAWGVVEEGNEEEHGSRQGTGRDGKKKSM